MYVMNSHSDSRRFRRTAPIVTAAGTAAIILAATAACGSDGKDIDRSDLGSSVVGMYRAVLSHDYVAAYDYRSQRCKNALSFEEYQKSVPALIGDVPSTTNFEYKIVGRAPGRATVSVTFDNMSVPSISGYSRLWIYDDNVWKYDNCD